MITIGYGIALIYLAALSVSAFGSFMLGRQVYRSRSAAIFFFLWGTLASLAVIVLLTGIVHGFWAGSGLPYILHIHAAEFHLHNSFPLEDASLTLCNHIAYMSLQLPPHTYLLPMLAIGIPLASFLTNQAYMSRVHRKLSHFKDDELSSRLQRKMSAFWPGRSWELMVVEGAGMEALSYSLLRPSLRPRRLARDVVVVTKGLYRRLSEQEIIASLAHEVAHLEVKDHRYLTFFKTLCGIVFFDPAVVLLSRKLCKEAEFRADYEAARTTRKPLALAKALLKVYLGQGSSAEVWATSGVGLTRAFLVERIERLLAMAREMTFVGDPDVVLQDSRMAPN